MSAGVKASQASQEFAGIRGWLIFPAIGMAASPVLGIGWLITGLKALEKMTNLGFGAYAIPRFVVNIGLLIYTFIAAVRFFKKRSNAPRTVIKLLAARAIAILVLFILGMVIVSGDSDKLAMLMLKDNNFIAHGLAAFVWIPYFRASKRVKATFVR